MNSLQILTILTTDKVDELREILMPKKYYALLYQSPDFPYIKFNSRNLFTSIENLGRFFIYLIKIDKHNLGDIYIEENNYPTCKCLDLYLGENDVWTSDQVLGHFISNRHYLLKDRTYEITEFQTINIEF